MTAPSAVIFLMGPTASGKTALSVQLAQQLNAEINPNNQLCPSLVSSNELNSLLGTYNETFLSRI